VLRIYDLKSRREEIVHNLDLEFFEPQLMPFGKNFTSEQFKFLSEMNSSIYNIFIEENFVFVIYDLAYTEYELQEYYKNKTQKDINNSPPN
jgi:hypothetical protein